MNVARSPLHHRNRGGEEMSASAHPAGRVAIAPITVRIAEAARMLRISRSRIYELLIAGDIKIVKLGRSTLIPVDTLQRYADRHPNSTEHERIKHPEGSESEALALRPLNAPALRKGSRRTLIRLRWAG